MSRFPIQSAMILCAGFGTRLGQLGEQCPKPLLPVLGLSILRYGIALLEGHGIKHIIINAHHHDHAIEREIDKIQQETSATIKLVVENPIPLGTGGALKHALPYLDPNNTNDPCLIMNGKLIIDADIDALTMAFLSHDQHPNHLGTMLVQPMALHNTYGALTISDQHHVTDFFNQGSHMFCGLHITRPSVINQLPDGVCCMVRQGYHPWITQHKGFISSQLHHGYFAEHSTQEQYLQSNIDLLNNPTTLTHPPLGFLANNTSQDDVTSVITSPIGLGKNVTIEENCSVGPNVFLDDGVTVKSNSDLSHCIVWKNTIVQGKHAQTIITS